MIFRGIEQALRLHQATMPFQLRLRVPVRLHRAAKRAIRAVKRAAKRAARVTDQIMPYATNQILCLKLSHALIFF